MTKKLYFVEVTKSGWVLAENEAEAQMFDNDIVDTEYLADIQVSEYAEGALKSSQWTSNCYVYHKDMRTRDITLAEALNKLPRH